jgi:hypothetical protein
MFPSSRYSDKLGSSPLSVEIRTNGLDGRWSVTTYAKSRCGVRSRHTGRDNPAATTFSIICITKTFQEEETKTKRNSQVPFCKVPQEETSLKNRHRRLLQESPYCGPQVGSTTAAAIEDLTSSDSTTTELRPPGRASRTTVTIK